MPSPRPASTTTRPGRLVPRARQFALVVLAATLPLAASLLTACGDGPVPAGATVVDDTGRTSTLYGAAPTRPLDKPALDLVDTAGMPFDLRHRTSGKLTYVYFGYTHCQDVCPTTMSDLAAALREVDASLRSEVAVVFVTVDPARDTPGVLTEWLGAFDPAFVGVTGPQERIHAAATAFGVDVDDPVILTDSTYNITHGTQTTVFTKDGRNRVVYPAGTPVQDYVHDLPILAAVGATV